MVGRAAGLPAALPAPEFGYVGLPYDEVRDRN